MLTREDKTLHTKNDADRGREKLRHEGDSLHVHEVIRLVMQKRKKKAGAYKRRLSREGET